MVVYQTLDGYYVGAVEAETDPLEPGRLLIPRGAVTVPPPSAPEGQIARWFGGSWLLVPVPEELVPPSPTPKTLQQLREEMVCSAFQARAALLQFGKLAEVESAVALAGPDVQLAWEYAIEWRRTSPTIMALAPIVGITEEQLDQLFAIAQTIEA
jgi:hypothetical protein